MRKDERHGEIFHDGKVSQSLQTLSRDASTEAMEQKGSQTILCFSNHTCIEPIGNIEREVRERDGRGRPRIEASRAFAFLTLSATSAFPADGVGIRTRIEGREKGSTVGSLLSQRDAE